MNFTEQSLAVNSDLQLNVATTESTEPTLIMLHGVTRRWQSFLPITHALAQRFRLMMVDFRGHGKSDRGQSYAVVDYVDDICRLIQDHVTGPVSIYGHSLGAMTAAGVAAQLGDRITSTVLEDPPLHTMGNQIATTPLLSYFTGVSQFAGDSRSVSEVATALGDVQFSDPNSHSTFRIGGTRNAAQLLFAASCLKKLAPQVFESILTGQWLAGYDVDSVFSTITCPTLLLQADENAGGMLTDNDSAHVTSLNPNVFRVRFPGIAHGIHWTATNQLLNTVLPFLSSFEG